MRKLLLVLAWCSCSLFVSAAPDPVDLGENLSYVRLRALADDTPAITNTTADTLIIDLRRVTGEDEAIKTFATALSQRAARSQLFLLVSAETPRALAKALETLPVRTLTLGTFEARPTPSVVIETDSAADRLAYEALESGTPISTLINGKITKERYDEATLVQEFKHGAISVTAPVSAKSDSKADASDSASTDSVSPTDRVLQRAVHLHRTLLALKK